MESLKLSSHERDTDNNNNFPSSVDISRNSDMTLQDSRLGNNDENTNVVLLRENTRLATEVEYYYRFILFIYDISISGCSNDVALILSKYSTT